MGRLPDLYRPSFVHPRLGLQRAEGGFISDKSQIKMQLPLQLVTFEYQNKTKIRTVTIDGEPWFYAADLCAALTIVNISDAVSSLNGDDIGKTDAVDSLGRRAKITIVNESGLYQLVFQSTKPEAKKFQQWVTKEVLPQIRKTGGFGRVETHVFVRRFNDNWDRVESGHFSVLGELYIRVFGKFEQVGHHLAERAPDGKQLRPDVSVGLTFPTFFEGEAPASSRAFQDVPASFA